jgi:hypothetical protein
VKAWVAVCCIALGASFPAAAQKAQKKKMMKKPRAKIERLACRLGTEDEHARIAVQLANGKVDSFAYYSKWKPQTCSMDVKRGDAYSAWEDTGDRTIVTLVDDTGAFLIDHSPGRYHFIFRDIDRMRYCGMEGKVSGSLTVIKGKQQCVLEGVMRKDGSEIAVQKPAAPTEAQVPADPAVEAEKAASPELEAQKTDGGQLEVPVPQTSEVKPPAMGQPTVQPPEIAQPEGKASEAVPPQPAAPGAVRPEAQAPAAGESGKAEAPAGSSFPQ